MSSTSARAAPSGTAVEFEDGMVFRALYVPDDDMDSSTTGDTSELTEVEVQEADEVLRSMPNFAPAIRSAADAVTATYSETTRPLEQIREAIRKMNDLEQTRRRLPQHYQEDFEVIRMQYLTLMEDIELYRLEELVTFESLHANLQLMIDCDKEGEMEAADECFRAVRDSIKSLNLEKCQTIITEINKLTIRIMEFKNKVLAEADIAAGQKAAFSAAVGGLAAILAVATLPVFWPMELAVLSGYALFAGGICAGTAVASYAAAAAQKLDEHLQCLVNQLGEAQAGLSGLITSMKQIREDYKRMQGHNALNPKQAAYLRRKQREMLAEVVMESAKSALKELVKLGKITKQDPFCAMTETTEEDKPDEPDKPSSCVLF